MVQQFSTSGFRQRSCANIASAAPLCHLLYLDFDGVLHPEDVYWSAKPGVYLGGASKGHALFEHAQRLLELMRPYPRVGIVLSTSWVPHRGFSTAVAQLPEELQRRVVGATYHSQAMSPRDWADIGRGYQILSDVRRRRPLDWVAVDDDIDDWPDEVLDKLVKTDGIDGIAREGAWKELESRFELWRQKA